MATQIKIRNAYSPREASKTNIKDFGASLTVQDQAKSTDINNIMNRYTKTGLVDHVSQYEPLYADFAALDYHTLKQQTKDAENAFSELPAEVRKQFNNQVENWLDHLANPDNIEDMKDGVIDNEIINSVEGSAASSATGASEPSQPQTTTE